MVKGEWKEGKEKQDERRIHKNSVKESMFTRADMGSKPVAVWFHLSEELSESDTIFSVKGKS